LNYNLCLVERSVDSHKNADCCTKKSIRLSALGDVCVPFAGEGHRCTLKQYPSNGAELQHDLEECEMEVRPACAFGMMPRGFQLLVSPALSSNDSTIKQHRYWCVCSGVVRKFVWKS
jgi:hypothetical protein